MGSPLSQRMWGGTSELVREDETGHLLKADFTPEELAELFRRLFRQKKEKHDALRQNCRRVWQEEFCAEVNFDRFAEEIRPQAE